FGAAGVGGATFGGIVGFTPTPGCHRPRRQPPFGQVSGLKIRFDAALRVTADSRRRNVGNRPLAAFRIGTADEALAGDDRAESIARAVTLGAMAWSIDEIRAAIPLVRLGGIGLEPLPVERKEFPAAEHAADLEIERQVGPARRGCT